jgi:Flp pilus assembly protein TadG
MKKMKRDNSEEGQAIVYLVIGMVVFLGFVALAIDGGMAMADGRRAQNGADSASLAGGAAAALVLENDKIDYQNWSCYGPARNNAVDTAISRASANSFSLDKNLDHHNGVITRCGSYNYGFFNDVYMDVTVDISMTTKSNFAQLVFPSVLHNEVDATTRVRPRQPALFGNALVALSPQPCQGNQYGALFLGNGDTNITGGGIFSNGCIRGNGSAVVNVDGGGIFGHYLNANGGDFNPDPETTTFTIPISEYDIPAPDCGDPHAHNITATDLEKDLKKGPVTLDPGLWCITGDLTINSKDTLKGTGVTIYKPNGKFDVNGAADIELSAPPSDPDPSPAIGGVLLYLPISNPSAVTLNGNSGSFYDGMIISPRSGLTLNGDASDYVHGQVVSWTVYVSGNNGFEINYNPDDGYQKPTSIELSK